MDTLSQESSVEELHHWVFGFVPSVPVSDSKSTLSFAAGGCKKTPSRNLSLCLGVYRQKYSFLSKH